MFLLTDDMIIYVENLKTIRTNKLISKLSCKIQNQYTKSICILYTNKGLSERDFKKTIPFTIASKRVKDLRINLTKEMKDLNTEN